MKTSLLKAVTLTMLFCSAMVKGQHPLSDKIREPDFLFQPVYLKASFDQPVVPLSNFTTLIVEGLRKEEKYYLLPGISSNFRINGGDSVRFIVRQNDVTSENVQTLYKLFPLSVNTKKANRRALYYYYKEGLLGNYTSMVEEGLPIRFEKVRDNIYLLTITNLSRGEYAIVRGNEVYSFGID
jgi:hypothetical protein